MRSVILCSALFLTINANAGAQRPGGSEIPTVAEKTAGMRKSEGFFNLYWEEKAEKMWLEIDKWQTEFLYVIQLPSSIEGRDRGSWNGGQVMKFDRAGSKVFLTRSIYDYRAISDDPQERRDVAEAYTEPVVFGFRIAAKENGHVLVDATDFFMRDAQNFGLGGVDKNRSAFYWPRTKNFPKNTEVEVMLTFNGIVWDWDAGPGR
jgi:hypothetical protein